MYFLKNRLSCVWARRRQILRCALALPHIEFSGPIAKRKGSEAGETAAAH
jgi:hypothetical protein